MSEGVKYDPTLKEQDIGFTKNKKNMLPLKIFSFPVLLRVLTYFVFPVVISKGVDRTSQLLTFFFNICNWGD